MLLSHFPFYTIDTRQSPLAHTLHTSFDKLRSLLLHAIPAALYVTRENATGTAGGRIGVLEIRKDRVEIRGRLETHLWACPFPTHWEIGSSPCSELWIHGQQQHRHGSVCRSFPNAEERNQTWRRHCADVEDWRAQATFQGKVYIQWLPTSLSGWFYIPEKRWWSIDCAPGAYAHEEEVGGSMYTLVLEPPLPWR